MLEYQVLARKYRPKNFIQLLGQSHVAQALSNAIDTGRLHHAYLFTGTRGVGKTTIARILAKCLNCETGITSAPCGTCSTCQAIDAGRFLDLIEIDAASRTKVEDTRELLDNVPYAPVQGRYKVYLIDEVHMLSTHSFNALLKTLEEPPAHAKFIFATTDPQKIPITIVSRCLQFVLRPLSQELLVQHLQTILQTENITYQEPALWQLAQSAKGSVRDCLSLTDQAIAFGGGQITAQSVQSMLGLVDSTDVLNLLAQIYADDRASVAGTIEMMRAKMVDAAQILDAMIDHVHQMALMQILQDLPLDAHDAQKAQLSKLSSSMSADVLQLYYEILIKSRDSIRLASTPIQALEMAILRLLAFRPLQTNAVPAHDTSPVQNAISTADSAPDTATVDTSVPAPTSSQPDEVESKNAIAPLELDRVNEQAAEDEMGCTDILDASAITDESASVQAPTAEPLSIQMSETLEVQTGDVVADVLVDETINHAMQTPADGTTESEETLTAVKESSAVESIAPNQAVQDLAVSAQISSTAQETTPPAEQAENSLSDTVSEAIYIETSPEDTQTIIPNAVAETAYQALSQPPAALDKQALLQRLAPAACELSGTWTAQKWDYWLAQARKDDIFDADELALLAHGEMTGEIAGVSTLSVQELNVQVTNSFNSLRQKIIAHYPALQLNETLQCATIENSPRTLQQQRYAQASIDMQNQLINSPVFQKLWHEGYIFNDNSLPISNFRLSV